MVPDCLGRLSALRLHWAGVACRRVRREVQGDGRHELNPHRDATAAGFAVLACVPRLSAGQTVAAPAGGHVHYAEPPRPALQASPSGALAPRLQNLGSHTFLVSTTSRQAQRFMNQGLNLAYAFNHAEARRAFREAARLDPNLAMAYWGQALVLGPNINAAMEPNEEPQAFELVQQAQKLRMRASVRERAYIDALAQRYSGKADDRRPRDEAYAAAMRQLHQKYPDDLDAAMLYVESVMDLRPWGYWQRDGAPHEYTADIVGLTERVIARNPKHPGAVHMYIHLMEGTGTPEKAERAADTLLTLMPAAGHMVHMPAHIYQRVGRYADAIKSNQLAIAADEDYISQCRAARPLPDGLLPAQHPLPVVRGDLRRPERAGDQVGARAGGQDRRRDAEGAAVGGGVPADAVLRADAVREVAGDAEGAGAARLQRCRCGRCGTTRAACRWSPPARARWPRRSWRS